MFSQILRRLEIPGCLALIGLLGSMAEAQVVSAPANFKSGPGASRASYSYAPKSQLPNQFQQGGFKITYLTPGFAADRANFRNGDVIIQVNGKSFRSEDELFGLLRQSSFTSKITYFEAGTGIVKMREVKHLFAKMGLYGEIVPLNGPPAGNAPFPIGIPPGAIVPPPGAIFPPPGSIVPPPSGPALPGL